MAHRDPDGARMTRVEIPVLTPIVYVDKDGKVMIACDTHATTALITPDRYHREANVRLVRAMYKASREWLVMMGEIDAPQEAAA